jgi:hypothetical protein
MLCLQFAYNISLHASFWFFLCLFNRHYPCPSITVQRIELSRGGAQRVCLTTRIIVNKPDGQTIRRARASPWKAAALRLFAARESLRFRGAAHGTRGVNWGGILFV